MFLTVSVTCFVAQHILKLATVLILVHQIICNLKLIHSHNFSEVYHQPQHAYIIDN